MGDLAQMVHWVPFLSLDGAPARVGIMVIVDIHSMIRETRLFTFWRISRTFGFVACFIVDCLSLVKECE